MLVAIKKPFGKICKRRISLFVVIAVHIRDFKRAPGSCSVVATNVTRLLESPIPASICNAFSTYNFCADEIDDI